MKKTWILILSLIISLSLFGCNTQTSTESEFWSVESEPLVQENLSQYFSADDDAQYIILPKSKEKIRVSGAYVKLLDRIDTNLLSEAEEKITNQVKSYTNDYEFSLQTNQEGDLCLCVELILKINLSDAVSGEHQVAGCGIDHEHKFFIERISR